MYSFIKRFFDVIFSALALLILAPLLIPITFGLIITGEGYVFYKQERVGYKNSIFYIFKFATMLKDSPSLKGGIITTTNDPRITPMGGFLRKSKINELPQLINILLGHMSIVGPRPVMQQSFGAYPDEIKKIIYSVKPGLTGIGSIVFRDEENLITNEKNKGQNTWDFYKNKIYPFKGKLELWYHKNKSFSTDLMIILITIWVVLFPKSEILNKTFKSIPQRNF